mgnify:CR=1 FL=1
MATHHDALTRLIGRCRASLGGAIIPVKYFLSLVPGRQSYRAKVRRIKFTLTSKARLGRPHRQTKLILRHARPHKQLSVPATSSAHTGRSASHEALTDTNRASRGAATSRRFLWNCNSQSKEGRSDIMPTRIEQCPTRTCVDGEKEGVSVHTGSDLVGRRISGRAYSICLTTSLTCHTCQDQGGWILKLST